MKIYDIKNEESPEKVEELRYQYDECFKDFKEKCSLYKPIAQYFYGLGDSHIAKKVEEYQKAEKTSHFDETVNIHGGNGILGGDYLKNIDNWHRTDNPEYQPPHLPIYNRCVFYSLSNSGITPWSVSVRLYVCIDNDGYLKPYITVFFSPEHDGRNPQGIENPEPQELLDWLRKITTSYIKCLNENS
jgi:hypothetical protein